jgi:coproporphyrinogen III oxidase
MKIKEKQKLVKEWFKKLQNIICNNVEQLEKEFGSNIKFKKNKWKHGEFKTIKGEVIEKGGVAFSNVKGKFSKEFSKKIPGTKNNTNFWSSGVSVVFHPKNPKIPAMHFNTRFICTQKNWFGGGMDMTPCILDNREKKYFHHVLKTMCNLHSKKYYPKYKKWCDKYFYLPHRKESRGIGGIFFDYKMDDWEKDFLFIKNVGITFNYLIKKIFEKKMFSKWTKKQKQIQLLKRGRYVEFNLLHDRGTKFGLNSGGNPEAILMSMPPEAKWK